MASTFSLYNFVAFPQSGVASDLQNDFATEDFVNPTYRNNQDMLILMNGKSCVDYRNRTEGQFKVIC